MLLCEWNFTAVKPCDDKINVSPCQRLYVCVCVCVHVLVCAYMWAWNKFCLFKNVNNIIQCQALFRCVVCPIHFLFSFNSFLINMTFGLFLANGCFKQMQERCKWKTKEQQRYFSYCKKHNMRLFKKIEIIVTFTALKLNKKDVKWIEDFCLLDIKRTSAHSTVALNEEEPENSKLWDLPELDDTGNPWSGEDF